MAQPSLSILRQVIESTATRPESTPDEVDTKLDAADHAADASSAPPAEPEALSPPPTPVLQPQSPTTRTLTVKTLEYPPQEPGLRVTGHSGHMKLLFDNAPVAMAMFDTQMHYLLANRKWLEDFKLKHLDVTGRSHYALFPGLHPGWRHVYERALSGQVVKSDRDVATQDGRKMVYRWEVRPWRNIDTTVGGVMITCSPLYASNEPPASTGETTGDQANAADLWSARLPILALNAQGVILRASVGASTLLLAHGVKEGSTPLWLALGERKGSGPLQKSIQQALQRVLETGEPATISPASEKGSAFSTEEDEEPVLQWVITRSEDTAQLEPSHRLLLAFGVSLPMAQAGTPPTPVVSAPTAAPPPNDTAIQELRAQADQAKQAEQVSRQRESRLRSVLDLAPCGLLVLDEKSRLIYENKHLRTLVGRTVEESGSLETWISAGCRDEIHEAELLRRWREGVWRKQLTLSLTLSTRDGLLKDIEMRPVSLPGGGIIVMMQDVTESLRSEEMLRSTEAKFRTLVHENPVAVVLTDRTGSVFDANPAAEKMLGRTRAELRRTGLETWLTTDSLSARTTALHDMLDTGSRSVETAVTVFSDTGLEIPITLRLGSVPDSQGEPMFTVHYLIQTEEMVMSEAPAGPVLLEELPQETLAALVADPESAEPQPIAEGGVHPLVATDVHGRIQAWSPEAVSFFGFPEAEAMGRALHGLFRPSDATGFYSELAALNQEPGAVTVVEWMYIHRNEGRKPGRFILTGSPAEGYVLSVEASVAAPVTPVAPPPVVEKAVSIGMEPNDFFLLDGPEGMEDEEDNSPIILDFHALTGTHTEDTEVPEAVETTDQVSDIVAAEEQPPADVPSKPFRPTYDELERERLLLGETHHRVKNHLQIITSMLNLQMTTTHNEEARSALRSSQNRVRSIAALHQHLQQLASGETKDIQSFATGLVTHLRSSFEVPEERVTLDMALPSDPVPDEWLMPLALALNEMISNAFKHAYPNQAEGHMEVSLSWNDEHGELSVTDDGVGLPGDFEDHPSPGMGLKILRVFGGQLGGEVTADTGPDGRGSRFTLTFPTRQESTLH